MPILGLILRYFSDFYFPSHGSKLNTENDGFILLTNNQIWFQFFASCTPKTYRIQVVLFTTCYEESQSQKRVKKKK